MTEPTKTATRSSERPSSPASSSVTDGSSGDRTVVDADRIAAAGLEDAFDEISLMPGNLLRRCQQIAVALFLRNAEDHELTPLQFATLATLAQQGTLDQVRLAGLIALDRTTISGVVTRLAERGLVIREPSESDRRSKCISLTESGLAVLAAAIPDARRTQEKILAPLAPAERQQLIDLLSRVAEANNTLSRAPLRRL